MPTTVRTVTATGGSIPIPIDLRLFRGGVGIIVTIPDGSAGTYDVEVTGDAPDASGGMSNWNKHDVLQNKSASANSNLAYPATAVRINPSAIVGSIVMAVVQVEG